MSKKASIVLAAVGMTVLLAVIAVCCVLNPPKVQIKTDGQYLSVGHHFREENYTVVWETDAGSLTSGEAGSLYTAPTDNSYYLYAGLGEKVKWSPDDPDGHFYRTATVKIAVYQYSESSRYYKASDKVYTNTLTVTSKDGIIQEEKARVFGNPVRDGEENDWQQIITLDRQGSYVTLRYRCGGTVKSPELFCWETNAAPLTAAQFGDAPLYLPRQGIHKDRFVTGTNTVCFDFRNFDPFYFDGTDPDTYPADIKISAFVTEENDLSEPEQPDDAAQISVKYYGGDADGSKKYEIEQIDPAL